MSRRYLASLAGVLAVGGAALAAYALVVRPWHIRWGATRSEATEPLPGDDLVTDPTFASTHAITIDAAPSDVWPWLVQIGQNRGGFYSYTALENLVGCRMRNAERIVPEWQRLEEGDSVLLHPEAPPLVVASVEPGRSFVLLGNEPIVGSPARTEEPGSGPLTYSWSFVLRATDGGASRLVVRSRASLPECGLSRLWGRAFLEPAHFVMERKMLLGIKRRAEARRRGDAETTYGKAPVARRSPLA
jgi:hypothetical protein